MGQLRKSSSDQRFQLAARVIVGRSPGCEMRLDDRRVSGEHAAIFYEESHWRIRDLASSNGTSVNGTTLKSGERHVLLQGDQIAFGSSDVIWEFIDEAPPPDRGILDTSQVGVALYQVSLIFRVSADEQDVEVTVVTPRERVRLAQRAFTDLLLHLARARLVEQKGNGLRENEQGWVHIDDLVPTVYPDTDTLNLNIFRARKQLESMGIVDASQLIERRVRSRRVRLGVGQLKVHSAAQTYRPTESEPSSARGLAEAFSTPSTVPPGSETKS